MITFWESPRNVYHLQADGGDCTSFLQAAINSVGYGIGVPAVQINVYGLITLSDTIDINRRAVMLRGSGIGNPANYPPNKGFGTTFKWAGAAGKPMFRIRDSQHVTFEDVHLSGLTAAPPSELVYFENVGGDIGTNQYTVFNRVRFGYLAWELAGYEADYCVRIGGVNGNNDQFVFRDCQFMKAKLANVQLDNTQSIWGLFDNCMFDGNNRASKGLVTSAQTTLRNAQFNNCLIDVEAKQTAQVIAYGHLSEGSGLIVRLPDNGGSYTAIGGRWMLQNIENGHYIEHLNNGGNGHFAIGHVVVGNQMTTRPKLYVRGNVSSNPGGLHVVNCHLPLADYDVQASTGTGGLNVRIDDDALNLHKRLVNNEALTLP